MVSSDEENKYKECFISTVGCKQFNIAPLFFMVSTTDQIHMSVYDCWWKGSFYERNNVKVSTIIELLNCVCFFFFFTESNLASSNNGQIRLCFLIRRNCGANHMCTTGLKCLWKKKKKELAITVIQVTATRGASITCTFDPWYHTLMVPIYPISVGSNHRPPGLRSLL